MQKINTRIIQNLKMIFNDEMLFGFSKLHNSHKTVVVMLKSYSKDIINYNEKDYHNMMKKDYSDLKIQVYEFIGFLENNNIKYHIPNPTQKDEDELLAELSYKYHAIKAGLGFIGKNDLFISHKYGARVRLSAVVIHQIMPFYQGDIDSKCDDCVECIKACPYDCLHNKTWHRNAKRDEIIDYKKCNAIRKSIMKDRKHTCGYCIWVCPYPITTN